MVKGASIKFKNYKDSVGKILQVLGLGKELKKYDKIVIKPALEEGREVSKELVEEVLKFCVENKNAVGDVIIAEGCDGRDTWEVFEEQGYVKLAEKYDISLVDLNETQTEEIEKEEFLRFESIRYPSILLESFVISLAPLQEHDELVMSGTLSTMLSAFPARHYKGFFTKEKKKIKRWPLKYSVHDIIVCKQPEFGLLDCSAHGHIYAGQPFEIDKQASRFIVDNWTKIPYLKLLSETFERVEAREKKTQKTKSES